MKYQYTLKFNSDRELMDLRRMFNTFLVDNMPTNAIDKLELITDDQPEVKKIEKLVIYDHQINRTIPLEFVADKVNEIIDYLNALNSKEESERESHWTCPNCEGTGKLPAEEEKPSDWETTLENSIFPIGIWHDSPSGYVRRLDVIKQFIRKLLENK